MWTIPDFPDGMREIPEDRLGWFAWREKVLALRTLIHRRAAVDEEYRAAVHVFASRDVAYHIAIFGCLVEPRTMRDFRVDPATGLLVPFIRPKGWYPWIPYGFQVGIWRTMAETLATTMSETGKDDLFIEKSRDVGATWSVCAYAGWDWLYHDDVFVGMLSHKEDLVDSDNPNSMFFKVKAIIGVNRKIPANCHAPGTIFHDVPVALPDYLVPGGWDPKLHERKLNLIHPTRTNQLFGESTTSKSMIGMRTGYNLLDEVSKIRNYLDIYSNQSAVTDHRISLTSPDRRESDDAYILAQQARAAARDPEAEGPRLISLPWDVHPLRDDEWYTWMQGRHAEDPAGFRREYEVDWDAGLGDWVYPGARPLLPGEHPYADGLGELYCTIDPGLRDPTAVVWVQYLPGVDRYRVVEALIVKTPSAEYLAPILMGFPPGHPIRDQYPNRAIQEVMDFTWHLRYHGVPVQYVGDPYGDNVSGANAESFYTVLALHAEALDTATLPYGELARRDDDELPVGIDAPTSATALGCPPCRIEVVTKYDERARYHQAPKEALTQRIPRLDFDKTERVTYVLQAVQNNRYKPQEEHRLVQNEPQEPAHDWTSHPTTALEYWAVVSQINELGSGAPPKPRKPSYKRAGRRIKID